MVVTCDDCGTLFDKDRKSVKLALKRQSRLRCQPCIKKARVAVLQKFIHLGHQKLHFMKKRKCLIRERAIMLRLACTLCKFKANGSCHVKIPFNTIMREVGLNVKNGRGVPGSYLRNKKLVKDWSLAFGWQYVLDRKTSCGFLEKIQATPWKENGNCNVLDISSCPLHLLCSKMNSKQENKDVRKTVFLGTGGDDILGPIGETFEANAAEV